MKFTKTIVVNPPSPTGYVSNKDSMGGFGQMFPLGATPFPPLDLIYLASYLVEKNYPMEIFECLAHELSKEQLTEKIAALSETESAPLVIVRTSAPTLDWDLGVCGEIKDKVPNARFGIYGSVVPKVLSRIQKEDFIDYIIKGDPDETVEALLEGKPESGISGLLFRREDEWIENATQPFIRELDKLPFPKWELLPYEKISNSEIFDECGDGISANLVVARLSDRLSLLSLSGRPGTSVALSIGGKCRR